jgi:ferredoxin
MRDEVRGWFEKGEVDIFLGYKMVDGHPLPRVFARDHLEELNELIVGPAYPLAKIATKVSVERPDTKIGLLARASDLRALNVLFVWKQLNPDQIKTLEVDDDVSNTTESSNPSDARAKDSGAYKKQVGIDNNMVIEEVEVYDQQQRFGRWMYEFQKCIKCYGCRNICPVCFCTECSLEHPNLVAPGPLPIEAPIFHLVRAVHMAGRCVGCGLCEEACPMNIPLRLLYAKVNQIVRDLFDYETGISPGQSPFNTVGDESTPAPSRPGEQDRSTSEE